MTRAKKLSTTKPATMVVANPTNKSSHIEVCLKPGESEDRAVAGIFARGLVTNAFTAIRYLDAEYKDLSLMDMARELGDQGKAVNGGDFAAVERLLTAQVFTLNAMFSELARRASLNMGVHLSATEAYLRLALKAQSQCRATAESLAAIKNPPVFARQANIAHGPQQVNNGAPANGPRAGAQARETQTTPNELSEASHELLQDTRASQAPSGTYSHLEPVEEIHRPA
jgi:hypothetical protein